MKHNQSSASHSQKERMFQENIASLRHEVQEEKSASKLIRSEIQLLQREFIDFQVKEKMRIESEIVEKANHQNVSCTLECCTSALTKYYCGFVIE